MKFKKFVGLELSEQYYSLVELEGDSKSGYTVNYQKQAEIPLLTLPGGERSQEKVIDWDLLVSQIREEFKNRGYSGATLTVTLPHSYYHFFLLSLPPIKGKDLKPFLEREIRKTHTFKEGVKYEIGYMRLEGKGRKVKGKKQDVLTVVIEEERLREFHHNFGSLNSKLTIYSIKPLSLHSLLVNFYPELKNLILMDVGKDTTDILFLKNGQLRFVRNVYLTLGNLETVLSKNLLVPLKVVREFVDKYGLDLDNYPQDEQGRRFKSYLLNYLGRFKTELQRSLLFYKEKIAPQEPLPKIYLVGSALEIKGVEAAFKKHLGIEAELLSPPEGLSFASGSQELKTKFPSYASAVGTSLIPLLPEKVNLAPRRERKKVGKNVHIILILGFLSIDTFIYYSFLGYERKLREKKQELERIAKTIGDFPRDLEENYKKAEDKRAEVKDLEEKFAAAQRPFPDWPQLFLEFGRLINKEVLITDFKIFFEEGKLRFEAQGEYRGTYPDAQLKLRKLRLALEESKFFKNVEFEISREGEVRIGEARVFSFKLRGLVDQGVLGKREL